MKAPQEKSISPRRAALAVWKSIKPRIEKAVDASHPDEGMSLDDYGGFSGIFREIDWFSDSPEFLLSITRLLHAEYGDNPEDAAIELEQMIWEKLSWHGFANLWNDALSQAAGTASSQETVSVYDLWYYLEDSIPVEQSSVRIVERLSDGSLSLDVQSEYLSTSDVAALKARIRSALPSGFALPDFEPSNNDEMVTVHPIYRLALGRLFGPGTTTTETAVERIKSVKTKSRVQKAVRRGTILKAADEGEERIVMGEVLVPDEVDAQGDIYSAEEVRKAAYYWMEQTGGQFAYLHSGVDGEFVSRDEITVLESAIEKADVELETFDGETRTIKKGTWTVTARVNDDAIWEEVKEGKITGFSIGAYALEVTP